MTLHPEVLADLLDAEVGVARDQLAGRVDRIDVASPHVDIAFHAHGLPWTIRLDGSDYDALPLALSVVDEQGRLAGPAGWPPGLLYTQAADHPVLHRPWACLRGTYEFHFYPGHTGGEDSWELSRADLRLGTLAGHILERCGA